MRMFQAVFRFLASLRLTVVLLGFAMILVFFGTLDQVHYGIHHTQELYFRSWIAFWSYPEQWPSGDVLKVIVLPIPGGYLVGSLLMLNLLFSRSTRIRRGWDKAGIFLIHLGFFLLLFGEALTGWLAVENRLWLNVGSSGTYLESYRDNELVVIDRSAPDSDTVTSIPFGMLDAGEVFRESGWPFEVKVVAAFPNAFLTADPAAAHAPGRFSATRGIAKDQGMSAFAARRTFREGEVDRSSAVVEVLRKDGSSFGTWLLSNVFDERFPVQEFEVDGKVYELALRFSRTYLPFRVHLDQFTHDRYPGTEIPRNFASQVRLTAPDGGLIREAIIAMNHPLRHGGLTFYQASFGEGDQASMLHVVKNPGWTIPYLASILMGVGMFWQFATHLIRHLAKRKQTGPVVDSAPAVTVAYPARPDDSRNVRWWAVTVALVCVLVIGGRHAGSAMRQGSDLGAIGSVPVQSDGRVKPFDSLARTSLMIIHGKFSVRYPDGRKRLASHWLMDVIARPDIAGQVRVFRVDHPEVLALMGYPADERNQFSPDEVLPHLARIQDQVDRVQPEAQLRSDYERHIMKLWDAILTFRHLQRAFHALDKVEAGVSVSGQYEEFLKAVPDGIRAIRLQQEGKPYDEAALARYIGFAGMWIRQAQAVSIGLVPPLDAEDRASVHWLSAGETLMRASLSTAPLSGAMAWARLIDAWKAGDAAGIADAAAGMKTAIPGEVYPQARVGAEWAFNQIQPFYLTLQLYVVALLLVLVSWMRSPAVFGRAAGWIVVIAWVLHTVGIVARMLVQGRPPVTNLYSSAVFVGWGTVWIAWIIERGWKNGIALATGALTGFATLVIAHNLGSGGDTLELMRAVLDSNFWLATHVVVITFGYSAMFLAGSMALIGILATWIRRKSDPVWMSRLVGSVYGVLCFALLFSFVGTVLGGIWADQSWGRFWGWDPKENGALLIVLFGALLLHAKWGRLVDAKGFLILSIGCNIVTAWSWFGTNMLGVGLHSYGFIDSAFLWLISFVLFHLAIMGMASLTGSYRFGSGTVDGMDLSSGGLIIRGKQEEATKP